MQTDHHFLLTMNPMNSQSNLIVFHKLMRSKSKANHTSYFKKVAWQTKTNTTGYLGLLVTPTTIPCLNPDGTANAFKCNLQELTTKSTCVVSSHRLVWRCIRSSSVEHTHAVAWGFCYAKHEELCAPMWNIAVCSGVPPSLPLVFFFFALFCFVCMSLFFYFPLIFQSDGCLLI